MKTPDISSESKSPRLVLITNGLRPLTYRFAELQGNPIGIVSWYGAESGGLVKYIEKSRFLAPLYARLRRRAYASLSHLCSENNLLYANIQKSQHRALHDILASWKPDLVITSGCPWVPVQALHATRFGGVNLHPSLLPAYRGADPLIWQVVDQVEYMGVSVHRLTEHYDAGSILAQHKELRPHGAHRQELLQRLEGEKGYELLDSIVSQLKNSDNLIEEVQPDASPTSAATKLSMHEIGRRWALDDLDAACVWDILKYHDRCPDQWLALNGWRRFFSWKPVSLQYVTDHDFAHSSKCWSIRNDGPTILLMNKQAIIKLRAVYRG
ncbi:formyltransferase family protein [Granulosicoccus sp. 3-233]|uniref:formyltransferase family protein n=1 Tax=Granulosicoccus sp. 3-233 TaxID=3417969 RepID=UPI003D33C5FA